jgi:hypothetical protein
VRNEAPWDLYFSSQQIFGLVGILSTAVVAPDAESFAERRWWKNGIGLGQWNGVPEEKVLFLMESAVFTENDPEILTVIAHPDPSQARQTFNRCLHNGSEEDVRRL